MEVHKRSEWWNILWRSCWGFTVRGFVQTCVSLQKAHCQGMTMEYINKFKVKWKCCYPKCLYACCANATVFLSVEWAGQMWMWDKMVLSYSQHAHILHYWSLGRTLDCYFVPGNTTPPHSLLLLVKWLLLHDNPIIFDMASVSLFFFSKKYT